MKPTLLLTVLSLAFAMPEALATSELETLRARCNQQEQLIRQLTAENQKLRGTAPATTSTTSQPAPAQPTSYTIRAGDSLERIARRHKCSPESLARINRLKLSSVIHPGQKIKLPGVTSPKESTVPASRKSSPSNSPKTYKIKEGDTYFSISQRHGIPVKTLIAANPKIKVTALRPGQMIRLSAPTAPKQPSAPRLFAQSEVTTVATTDTPAPTPKKSSSPAPDNTGTTASREATTPEPTTQETPLAPKTEKRIHSVSIEGEMTYGDFAAKHGTNTQRLNDLNGLDLNTTTVLAKGSELYVPAQP